jgi:hypothetical protein
VTTTVRDFVHEPLDTETEAIAGHYVLTREVRLPWDGRELLYLVGHAIFDTSCCGMGGCGYAIVPGYVVEWRTRTNERGRPVSTVEPVMDDAQRRTIEQMIKRAESLPQVQFI